MTTIKISDFSCSHQSSLDFRGVSLWTFAGVERCGIPDCLDLAASFWDAQGHVLAVVVRCLVDLLKNLFIFRFLFVFLA